MRRNAKAPSAGSTMGTGTTRARKSTFATVCLAAVALVAFLGSGAPTASAVDGPCPNAEFRTGPSASLPDCRAYEQVSPVDKNGVDIGHIEDHSREVGPVAPDGNAAAFMSSSAFADAEWGGLNRLSYLARRNATGWTTTTLSPRPADPDRTVGGLIAAFSTDLGMAVLEANGPLTPGAEGSPNLYRRDNATHALALLVEMENGYEHLAASADLTHVAFDTRDVMTDEVGQPASNWKVYEHANGTPRLVSRNPDGEPMQTETFLGSTLTDSTEGAVSDDGAHIFFSSGGFGPSFQKVYRRSSGTTTVLASPSKRTTPDPNGEKAKVFQLATGDGNRVFFTSVEQLTDDANRSGAGVFQGDLYRYDLAAEELVNLSAGTSGSDPAEVSGVVAIGVDGGRAYFVSTGLVVPGEGELGEPNLYLWEDNGTAQGSVRFVATLDDDDASDKDNPPDLSNWEWRRDKGAQASANGSRLVFQSRRNLTSYDQEGLSQVYLYDATGAGHLTCLSCPADGEEAAGASLVPAQPSTGKLGAEFPRSISIDGDRVIFSTPHALLSRDTNDAVDAYLWDEGQFHLISTGTSSDDSYAFGLSESGADAFLKTREALVPADVDGLIDVYTAHVNGGFLSQQNLLPPVCTGEECREGRTSAPPGPGVASGGDLGAGNPPTADRCARHFRKAARLRRLASRIRHSTDGKRRAAVLAKRYKRERAKGKRCRAAARRASR